MKVAIIPARAGSKRIPRKNLKDFLGRPIISYSIEASIAANLFDRVIVSTDSQEIADLALSMGAEVPFLRSSKNSDDLATTIDVLKEVQNKLNINELSSICCIYPTAPFISAKNLRESYDIFINGDYDSLCPIVEYDFPIQRAFIMNSKDKIEWMYKEYALTRSQDLTPAYHDVGQFYWLKNNYLKSSSVIVGENTGFYLIDPAKAMDIDTPKDWDLAELKFKLLNK